MSIIEKIRIWFVNLFTYEVNEETTSNNTGTAKSISSTEGKESNTTKARIKKSKPAKGASNQNNSKGTSSKKTTRKFSFPIITFRGFVNFLRMLVKSICRCIAIGIILNVIASYFYPELSKRIPAIFGWYDGWMQFGEFLAKYVFGLLNALIHGMNETGRYLTEFPSHFNEMWMQFINWLSTIHY